jgi:hypothetical protein
MANGELPKGPDYSEDPEDLKDDDEDDDEESTEDRQ